MDKLAKLQLARDIERLAADDDELSDILKTAKDPSLYDRYNEAKDAWLNDCAVAAESLSKGEDVQFRADKVGGGFMYLDVRGQGVHSGLAGKFKAFFPGGEYGEVVASFESHNRDYKGYEVRWTIIVQTPQSFYYQFLKQAFKELSSRSLRASRTAARGEKRAEIIAQINGSVVDLMIAEPTDDPTMIEGYQHAEPMEKATPESRALTKDGKAVLKALKRITGINRPDDAQVRPAIEWVHAGEHVTRVTIFLSKRGHTQDRKAVAQAIADELKRMGYRIARMVP